MTVVSGENVASVPQIEMYDSASMHRIDRGLELGQEASWKRARKRTRQQHTGPILEDQRLAVDVPQQTRHTGHTLESLVSAHFPAEQPTTKAAPNPCRPRREVLHNDRSVGRSHEQYVGIAPAAAIQEALRRTSQSGSIQARGRVRLVGLVLVGLAGLVHPATQCVRSQNTSSPPSTAINVPSSLLSEYRSTVQTLFERFSAASPALGFHSTQRGQSAGTACR